MCEKKFAGEPEKQVATPAPFLACKQQIANVSKA